MSSSSTMGVLILIQIEFFNFSQFHCLKATQPKLMLSSLFYFSSAKPDCSWNWILDLQNWTQTETTKPSLHTLILSTSSYHELLLLFFFYYDPSSTVEPFSTAGSHRPPCCATSLSPLIRSTLCPFHSFLWCSPCAELMVEGCNDDPWRRSCWGRRTLVVEGGKKKNRPC
jgi:hypothetical protein